MRTIGSKIRRPPARQKNLRKKKKPQFQIGQGITITSGTHSGMKGKILKINPKYAVIQIKRRSAVEEAKRTTSEVDASKKAQRQVFQQMFIRVGLKNVQLPQNKTKKSGENTR